MSKELLRYRKCAVCYLAATENTDLCCECLADEDYRRRTEAPVPNEEWCGRCGGVLSRHGGCGWCEAQDIRAFNERMVHVG